MSKNIEVEKIRRNDPFYNTNSYDAVRELVRDIYQICEKEYKDPFHEKVGFALLSSVFEYVYTERPSHCHTLRNILDVINIGVQNVSSLDKLLLGNEENGANEHKYYKICYQIFMLAPEKTRKDILQITSSILSSKMELILTMHRHSIVLIKDDFQELPRRRLVYEDNNWGCEFFLNYKDNPQNNDFIKDCIFAEFGIDTMNIKLYYAGSQVHEKYSESAKENRMYKHKFFVATIDQFPEFMKKDSFKRNGKIYHWRTIAELENDENIQKKNMDIVKYVKGLY